MNETMTIPVSYEVPKWLYLALEKEAQEITERYQEPTTIQDILMEYIGLANDHIANELDEIAIKHGLWPGVD